MPYEAEVQTRPSTCGAVGCKGSLTCLILATSVFMKRLYALGCRGARVKSFSFLLRPPRPRPRPPPLPS